MVVSPAWFPAAHDRRHPGSRFVVGPREQLVMRHSADLAKQVRIADQLEPDIDVTTPIRGRPRRCTASLATRARDIYRGAGLAAPQVCPQRAVGARPGLKGPLPILARQPVALPICN